MAEKHVFPQSGDDDYAENFGQIFGRDNLSDYVERGMGLTADYAVPEVTIGTGIVFIKKDTTISDTGETRLDTGYLIQMPQTTKTLTDSAVNHVYVEPGVGTDDNATFQIYSSETSASSTALKIGEVDTSADTITEVNRDPSISAENLDVSGTAEITGSTTLASDVIDGSSNVIYDQSNNWINQARLENDSVTVTAGDGLKNGGSVSLGSSTTINVEPADFAGAFLSDDGSDNLTVDLGNGLEGDGSGNIQINSAGIAGAGLEEASATSMRIDEDYSFTWTSAHTFRNDVRVDPGSSSLTDGGTINSTLYTLTGYYDSDGTTTVSPTSVSSNLQHVVNADGSSTLDVRVQATDVLQLNSDGSAVFPNGNVSTGGNSVTNIDDLVGGNAFFGIRTDGGGSSEIHLFDNFNTQKILVAKEGGAVNIPNGTLQVNGTTTLNSNLNMSTSGSIQDSGTDAIGFDGSQNVSILNGNLQIATDGDSMVWGANSDFEIFYENANNELVLRDSGGIELLRQPKSGPMKFLQGAEIGSIEAPDDSLTQLVNASVTSSPAAGTAVGYNFMVDSVGGHEIYAEADGAGGVQTVQHRFYNSSGTEKIRFENNGDIVTEGTITEGGAL